MTISTTAAELQTGVKAAQDILAAMSAGLRNISADEAVLMDAAKIAALVDPALAPLVVVLPIAMAVLAWAIANDSQGRQGSQTPIHDVRRGSLGEWDDGA